MRQSSKLIPALLAAARGMSCGAGPAKTALQAMVAPAVATGLSSCTSFRSSLHFSAFLQEESAPAPKLYEPSRKFRSLADKELWHEAWMYEDRFGTEEDPIVVPSLEDERIIGVTDPEDDNLVVWGILKTNEPPRQFIEGGEYYVLKVVPYVAKVGDVLELQASAPKAPLPK